MEAWNFNGNERGNKIIENDEKKNVFNSRNYSEKKKRIVKQCVVENTQRDGRKAFDKMEKLKCLAENPLLYQFKRWLLVV